MPTTRKLADIEPSERIADHPARVLVHGLDTWVETYSVAFLEAVKLEIERSKRVAEQYGDPVGYTPLSDEIVQVSPYGVRGFRFVLENPDFSVLIRTWDHEYNTTVRYSAAGLWQCGLEALRERVRAILSALGAITDEESEPTLSRFDYAFDLDAPWFAPGPELIRDFVCPPRSKWRMEGTWPDTQTFTIGKMPGLQVQLYNKSDEIREASGKDWFYQIWGLPADHPYSVWRVEVRFGGQCLKDRNIRGYGAAMDTLPQLLSGALVDRRLTDGDASRNRRAAVHPVWWAAIEAAGNVGVTIAKERRITASREEMEAILRKNLAGVWRTAAVVAGGDFDDATAEAILDNVRAAIADDKEHARKVDQARERYAFLGVPR